VLLALLNRAAGRAPLNGGLAQISCDGLRQPGAAVQAPVSRVAAQGLRANGAAMKRQAACFSRRTRVFQAVMYAAKSRPEVAETFFASLKFQ
jgi:hypothetical protein